MEKTGNPQLQTGKLQQEKAGEESGQKDEIRPHSAVDNAHAAGLGAMGRNDEKLPLGEDAPEGTDEPVY